MFKETYVDVYEEIAAVIADKWLGLYVNDVNNK
jgi:hypothetical protein